MFVTVYVDLETFKHKVAESDDFYAALTPGEFEVVQLSVPMKAVYESEHGDDMVSVRGEVVRRMNVSQ